MSRRERNIKLVNEFEQEHSRAPFDLHEVYDRAEANRIETLGDVKKRKIYEVFCNGAIKL